MRILHVSKYYYPFRGGIEKVVEQLAEGASAQGHVVTVLCSGETNLREEFNHNGVKIIKLPRKFVFSSQPFCIGFSEEFNKLQKDNDVIHVHMPNPLFEWGILKSRAQIPILVTYHCEVLNKSILSKLYHPIANLLLKKASAISCATPQHIEYSRNLKKYKNKISIIPFGISGVMGEKTLSMLSFIKKNRIQHGDYFLFVGRLVAYKGLGFLIKAMEKVDAKLLIIGKGPRFGLWKGLVQNLKLDDKIIFLGSVDSDEEFSSYFHAAKGLVLPSVDASEAYGMVQVEAMCCKLPVISTKLNSGVVYVNKHNETGLVVEPKNSIALSTAMNTFLRHEDMRLKMGEAAFKRFQAHFQLKTMVDSYVNLYSSLLSNQITYQQKLVSA